jgi:hypothetical protein
MYIGDKQDEKHDSKWEIVTNGYAHVVKSAVGDL